MEPRPWVITSAVSPRNVLHGFIVYSESLKSETLRSSPSLRTKDIKFDIRRSADSSGLEGRRDARGRRKFLPRACVKCHRKGKVSRERLQHVAVQFKDGAWDVAYSRRQRFRISWTTQTGLPLVVMTLDPSLESLQGRRPPTSTLHFRLTLSSSRRLGRRYRTESATDRKNPGRVFRARTSLRLCLPFSDRFVPFFCPSSEKEASNSASDFFSTPINPHSSVVCLALPQPNNKNRLVSSFLLLFCTVFGALSPCLLSGLWRTCVTTHKVFKSNWVMFPSAKWRAICILTLTKPPRGIRSKQKHR